MALLVRSLQRCLPSRFCVPKITSHPFLRSAGQPSRALASQQRPQREWSDTGLSPLLCKGAQTAVGGAGSICHPTEIQFQAIQKLMQGKDAILAAPTGTGKTLSYVLPIVEMFKRREAQAGHIGTRPSRPFAIILVPTRELANQVLSVLKAVGHTAKFRCAVFRGGDIKLRNQNLHDANDIVVATPGAMRRLIVDDLLYLGDVRHVVLDEVDALCDDVTFAKDVKAILKPVVARRRHTGAIDVQFVYVGATLSRRVRSFVCAVGSEPPVEVVVSGLNTPPSRLEQRFVKLGRADRITTLIDVIQSEPDNCRTMIFANSARACRAVGHAIAEQLGELVSSIHSGIPYQRRRKEYAAFLANESRFLVATDLAARGLDPPSVGHIINFEFPTSAEYYLHRIGRTARASNVGIATSIVHGREKQQADRITLLMRESLESLFMDPYNASAHKGRGRQRNLLRRKAQQTQHDGSRPSRSWTRQAAPSKKSHAHSRSSTSDRTGSLRPTRTADEARPERNRARRNRDRCNQLVSR